MYIHYIKTICLYLLWSIWLNQLRWCGCESHLQVDSQNITPTHLVTLSLAIHNSSLVSQPIVDFLTVSQAFKDHSGLNVSTCYHPTHFISPSTQFTVSFFWSLTLSLLDINSMNSESAHLTFNSQWTQILPNLPQPLQPTPPRAADQTM